MSHAIDARVVLALATKASQVFAQDGTYLSIPLSPLAYEADAISAISDLTPEGARMEAELSCLVNTIPDGPIWRPVGGSYLWDVYGHVLADAELATTRRTAQQEKRYRKALAVLTVPGPNGLPVESPAVTAYRACRDEWLTALQEYTNQKGHIELSGDASAKAQWAEFDEPALRARIADAREKWITQGHREQVDAARATVRRLGDRSPRSAWERYVDRFDPETPEIYFRTHPDFGRYVPSALRPSDIVDREWYEITLEAGELAALADQAPPDLKARLISDQPSGVRRLSFQYTSVGVSRPWLAPEVFESRAWRVPDGEPPLSDGAPQPQGSCTAYVVGLVLARNVSVTPLPPSPIPAPADPGGSPVVGVTRDFHLGFVSLEKARVLDNPSVVVARPLATQRPQLGRQPLPSLGLRQALRPIDGGDFPDPKPRPFPRPLPSPSGPPQPQPEPQPQPAPQPPPAPAPPPQPNPDAPVVTPEGEIYVLGFICKRLRQCPNPDPALHW